MPLVMLPHDHPNQFRRTVEIRGRKSTMTFYPGIPVDLKPAEVDALSGEIGTTLRPVMKDDRGRIRMIREDAPAAITGALDVAQAAG